VDGFRVDVVHALGKDPALPDEPPGLAGVPHAALNDHASTHPILRRMRRLVDAYPGDRVLVGEVFLLGSASHPRYYGRGDELHLVFELPAAVLTPWDAAAWRERIAHILDTLGPIDAWPTWVLSNHDTPRHRTRFGSEARARAAAVLLLTLPGTPFLYAGEELGLEDAVVTPDRALDPGGRDGSRAPIPWTAAANHGWPAVPWLPWPPGPECRNVGSLRTDPTSILYLYRRLLAARRSSPALRLGICRLLPAPDGVLAYTRIVGHDRRTVVVNFAASERAYPLSGTVVVASDGRDEGRPYRGALDADAAVIVSEA
jgi:alpha-glucosidase